MTYLLLADRWWALALRGVAAIVFGILTFVAPQASFFALVLLFGAYAIVNGAILLALALRRPSGEPRWGSLAFEGILSILAGAVTLGWPRIGALALVFIVASWAVVTGIAQIVAAVRLRKRIRGEWLLALSGALSVAFGVLLFAAPAAGAVALALWIGAYALMFGALLLALGIRLRAWGRSPAHRVPPGGLPATT